MLTVSEIKLDTWDQIKQAVIERQDQPHEVVKLVYRVWLEVPDSVLPDIVTRVRRESGLCIFLGVFSIKAEISILNLETIADYQKQLLAGYFNDAVNPFGDSNYKERHCCCTQHQDPARIRWVNRVLSGEVE